jgi:hypothetical protein
VEILFAEGQGIVDGGHTYELAEENRSEIEELNAGSNGDRQMITPFLKLEVLTGFPSRTLGQRSPAA